jgi:hypothetical protein
VPGYEGRLELTWTNMHLRLLAHEDGSYEWLDPSDYRVAEVRLLHDVTTVGTVVPGAWWRSEIGVLATCWRAPAASSIRPMMRPARS